jgi:cell shape-determining protein MreC
MWGTHATGRGGLPSLAGTRMSAIKFHHVFAALLLLSALSAFVIPERYTAKAQPQVQSLFYPVAKPVRSVAGAIHGRLARPETKDARDSQTLLEENEQLRQEFAALSQQLEELRRINAERSKLGPIRDQCTPVAVVGNDAGGREGLLLRGSTLEGLREGQVVLFAGGVVGKIERPPGLAGAQVRLITDKGMRTGACFGRWANGEDGTVAFARLRTPAILVEGTGDGAMRVITDLTKAEVTEAKLAPNDWVVVEDPDWDPRVQTRRLGKVVHVAAKTTAPLYADIRVEPVTSLMRLREVMVVTK